MVAVPWLEVMLLPNASSSRRVHVDVLEPFAVMLEGLEASVDRAGEKPPAVVVIVGAVPETELSFAVTAWLVPALVRTVKPTVATPLPLVVLVAVEKEPPLVLDHVTVRPDAATTLLLASTS
jgi:hypothetical protein